MTTHRGPTGAQAVSLDIHDYEQKCAYAERQIRESNLSARNKGLILAYRDACLAKGVCGRARLVRVQGCLLLFGRLLKKDFDTCTRTDIEQLLHQLATTQPAYSAETLGTYKAILKSFMTWVVQPNDFPTKTPPAIVAGITSHVPPREKPLLNAGDLLTPLDIAKLLSVGTDPRNHALIALLWETGARIAEIGNLQLRHVTVHEHGYLIAVTGKKMRTRQCLVISSAPYLTTWLQQHPCRYQPDAPLWVTCRRPPEQLKYDALRHLLQRYFLSAGVTKPFHPQIFRHSRAAYVLAQGIMNPQAAKAYFGWTPTSDMISTYNHVLDHDGNAAILRENQPVRNAGQSSSLAQARACPHCGAASTVGAENMPSNDDIVRNLVNLLVQKGLLDEAARELHDAGLGTALQVLARHSTLTPGASTPLKCTAPVVPSTRVEAHP